MMDHGIKPVRQYTAEAIQIGVAYEDGKSVHDMKVMVTLRVAGSKGGSDLEPTQYRDFTLPIGDPKLVDQLVANIRHCQKVCFPKHEPKEVKAQVDVILDPERN